MRLNVVISELPEAGKCYWSGRRWSWMSDVSIFFDQSQGEVSGVVLIRELLHTSEILLWVKKENFYFDPSSVIKTSLPDYPEYAFFHSRYLQKPGSRVSIKQVTQWARRPIAREEIYVIGSAYHPYRGYSKGAIMSANNALNDKWKIPIPSPLQQPWAPKSFADVNWKNIRQNTCLAKGLFLRLVTIKHTSSGDNMFAIHFAEFLRIFHHNATL